MVEKKVEITARTEAEFKKLSKLLTEIPEDVRFQIDNIRDNSLSGRPECAIKQNHNPKQRVWLPKNVTQITEFDTYVAIYTPSIIYKVERREEKNILEYIFIQEDQAKK